VAPNMRLQVDPIDVLHHDELSRAVLAILVDGADVGVTNLARQFYLGLEAAQQVGCLVGRGPQYLDGHSLVEFTIVGSIHDPHAASAEALLDLVPVGEEGAGSEGRDQGFAAAKAIVAFSFVRGSARR